MHVVCVKERMSVSMVGGRRSKTVWWLERIFSTVENFWFNVWVVICTLGRVGVDRAISFRFGIGILTWDFEQ